MLVFTGFDVPNFLYSISRDWFSELYRSGESIGKTLPLIKASTATALIVDKDLKCAAKPHFLEVCQLDYS